MIINSSAPLHHSSTPVVCLSYFIDCPTSIIKSECSPNLESCGESSHLQPRFPHISFKPDENSETSDNNQKPFNFPHHLQHYYSFPCSLQTCMTLFFKILTSSNLTNLMKIAPILYPLLPSTFHNSPMWTRCRSLRLEEILHFCIFAFLA